MCYIDIYGPQVALPVEYPVQSQGRANTLTAPLMMEWLLGITTGFPEIECMILLMVFFC